MDGRVLGRRARRQRLASRLLQFAIAAMLLVGLVRLNLSVVVNAALALAVTFMPAAIARDRHMDLAPAVTLWLTLALFLHTLGMLGIYGEVWWYDHATHTLSAALVAGVGYAAVRAVDDHSDAIRLPPTFTFVFVLVFTLGLGVFWEVLEFGARIGAEALGFEPVLVQYGLDDSLLDLVFDTVGAVLVAAFGASRVAGLSGSFREWLAARQRGEYEGPSLEAVIREDVHNAGRAWLLLGGVAVGGGLALLAGAALSAVAGAAVIALALGPVAATRNPRIMLPWRLVALAGLPVFGAVLAPALLASGPAAYLAVAAIALVVAVELHVFTPVEMTPGFAVGFVVVATMAAAGAWAVARWLLDLAFGTTLLLKPGVPDAAIETALMWEFVFAAGAGVLAGLVFERGFRRRARAEGTRTADRRT